MMSRYEAQILLDNSVFPRGRYEVEIRRGATYKVADFSASAYTVAGVVWDFWGYQGTPGQIVFSRSNVMDTLLLLRSVSVWNEHPLPTDDCAIVAVRARNRSLDSLSVFASGYVRDWDGTGWDNWTITDNPAPHLRAIWTGQQNLDPVPEDLIDDDELLDWRSACASKGYRCNAILNGETVMQAAEIVAGCGYAKPRMTERWGVARDYDRSAEAPIQIFTPRNSRGFEWTKAFPRLPDGFRVSFQDETRDYDTRQITVMRPGRSDDSGLLEQVRYQGLTTATEVIARAHYDLAQATARGVYYTLEAPAEAIICQRGDLVGVQHHMLSSQAGAGRVIDWTIAGSDISAIRLDCTVPVANEADLLLTSDILAVADMRLLGLRTGAAIRRTSGSVTVHEVSTLTGETDTLEFDPPIPATGIANDVLIAVGALGSELLRVIVFAVEPRADLTASLTLVDEGKELWS